MAVRSCYPVNAKRFLQMRGVPIAPTCRGGQQLDQRSEELLGSLLETHHAVGDTLAPATTP